MLLAFLYVVRWFYNVQLLAAEPPIGDWLVKDGYDMFH